MRLSIVVPVYNEACALSAQSEHLRALQSGDHDLEVLLVDGGSDDGTLDLLRDSGLPWCSSARGRSAQMNLGAARATGDVLLFLHADTLLPAGSLERVRGAVASGAVAGFFGVSLDSASPLLRLVGRMITLRSRLSRLPTGDQAIFVTRRAFEQLGGYAPLPLFEDLDLARRLRDFGRVEALDLRVRTSPRRWERCGPWRTILSMWALRGLYTVGLRPERLARYYGVSR